MFNIYSNLCRKKAEGQLTFDELITKIRTQNPAVEYSRKNHIKGTSEYQQFKENKLEAFSANCFNKRNFRNSKYLKNTGYIFVDIDGFSNTDDAIQFKDGTISKLPFVAACWLSLSNLGLSILIKVEKCNQGKFLKCYEVIKSIIPEIDTRVIDYKRLCIISHDPNIYVNKNAVGFDVMYQIEQDYLIWRTQIPDSEFKDVNTPVVYPEGMDYLEINPNLYKKNKIKVGKRNSTLGLVSMQLLYLNPHAEFNQIFNAVNQFNKNYCEKELSDKEVLNLVKNNFEKKEKLDVSKYFKRKQVFFHKECPFPRNIKREIIAEEKRKINQTLITDTINVLQIQGIEPTVNAISEFTLFSESKVYRLMQDVPFSQRGSISYSFNMSEWEKGTFELSEVQSCIYEAIEDLQGLEKITQQRIADYINYDVKTIKRNWLPCFKDLVKTYNDGLKKQVQKNITMKNVFPAKRDILSTLPDDANYELFVTRIENSRIYQEANILQVA